MAKKRHDMTPAPKPVKALSCDESDWGEVLWDATYTYDANASYDAIEQIGPAAKRNCLIASFVSLSGMLVVLVIFRNQLPPALPFLVVALASLWAQGNWDRVQRRLSRDTTLPAPPESERRRFTVEASTLHQAGASIGQVDYNLADLKKVQDCGSFLLLYFSKHRFAYVPKNCFSVSRLTDLTSHLKTFCRS